MYLAWDFSKLIEVCFTPRGRASGRRPLNLATSKRHGGSGLKDHVGAAPGGIVGQLPTVSGADGVLGEQNISGVEKEMLTAASLEIQRAAQRDNQLPNRRSMPGEGAPRCRFLERDGGDGEFVAQPVAALAWFEFDDALFEIRVLVIAGP